MSRNRRPRPTTEPKSPAVPPPGDDAPAPEDLRDVVRAALDGKLGAAGADGKRVPPPGRAPNSGPGQGQFKGGQGGGGKGFRALPRRTG